MSKKFYYFQYSYSGGDYQERANVKKGIKY